MSIRALGARRMSSVNGWRQMNSWFASQAAATQQDQSANNAANSAFSTAQSNYIQNVVNLSANAALKRDQAQSKTTAAQLQALINSVGSNVNTVA